MRLFNLKEGGFSPSPSPSSGPPATQVGRFGLRLNAGFPPKRAFPPIDRRAVIAIFFTPAAFFFPAVARSRENARRSSCQSNLKQLSLAVAQYSQDYDEQN